MVKKKHPSGESGIITPRRHRILAALGVDVFWYFLLQRIGSGTLGTKTPAKKNRRPNLGMLQRKGGV